MAQRNTQSKPEVNGNATDVTCKTRVDEKSTEKVETKLTILWDDENATREFAKRGVVIAAQSIWRATGDIPASYEVRVSELAKRERGGFAMKPTPQNVMRLLGKMDDAQRVATLKELGLRSDRDIKSILSALSKPTK